MSWRAVSFCLWGGRAFSHPSIRTAYRRIRNKTDANDGRALFLANCAPCHGLAARGGRGPALVGRQLVHGASDKEILTVVQEGVPGSAMPAFGGSPDELHNIMAYIRSLSGAAASKAPHPGGNAALGSAAYERYGCAGCHRIGNTGSVFGPELTRVGASRSYDYLKQSLLDPSADITPGAEGITVTTLDGRRVVGIRVNEDTFTVQLRDQSQKFLMFEKSQLKAVVHETKSLMPSYASLPKEDLENLLADLLTLHGDVNGGAAMLIRVLR